MESFVTRAENHDFLITLGMCVAARVRVFIVSLCFRNCTGDSVISLDDIWRQTSISTVLNISSSGHCVLYEPRNMRSC